jgi:hypothetical protein
VGGSTVAEKNDGTAACLEWLASCTSCEGLAARPCSIGSREDLLELPTLCCPPVVSITEGAEVAVLSSVWVLAVDTPTVQRVVAMAGRKSSDELEGRLAGMRMTISLPIVHVGRLCCLTRWAVRHRCQSCCRYHQYLHFPPQEAGREECRRPLSGRRRRKDSDTGEVGFICRLTLQLREQQRRQQGSPQERGNPASPTTADAVGQGHQRLLAGMAAAGTTGAPVIAAAAKLRWARSP